MSDPAEEQPLSGAYLIEFRVNRLVGTAIAFIVIDIIFVALRFWARRFQKTGKRADDCLVLFSLIFCIGICIDCICAVQLGSVGRHIEALSLDEVAHWLKTTFITAPVLYIFAVTLPKIAILCVFLTVFVDKFSRVCCYITGTILIFCPITMAPMAIWQCTPLLYLWDKSIEGGWCFNQDYLFRYGSLPNMMTDVVMLILPIPVIWRLQTSRRVKAGLVGTFLLSSIGLITAIIRFVQFFQSTKDGPWAAVPLLTWTIVEPSVYLVATCLLSFRPLLSYLMYESLLSAAFSRASKVFKSRNSTNLSDSHDSTGKDAPTIELGFSDRSSYNKTLIPNWAGSSEATSDWSSGRAGYEVDCQKGIRVDREFTCTV